MNQPDLNNESIRLLAKIYTWRKKLLIVSLIAAIVSLIISFIVSPQYKATAIVFPSRTFSVSKLLIEQNQGAQNIPYHPILILNSDLNERYFF